MVMGKKRWLNRKVFFGFCIDKLINYTYGYIVRVEDISWKRAEDSPFTNCSPLVESSNSLHFCPALARHSQTGSREQSMGSLLSLPHILQVYKHRHRIVPGSSDGMAFPTK